jgi:Na+-translocating ferredoxin:NAD+ oxidoreductase RnfE subunit
MRARIASIGLLLALWGTPALAQGCAMCYSTAAAASKDGQRAIDKAVLILLAPPVGFMTLGVGMALRYGRKRDEEQGGE